MLRNRDIQCFVRYPKAALVGVDLMLIASILQFPSQRMTTLSQQKAFVFPDLMILKPPGQDLDLIVVAAISIFE